MNRSDSGSSPRGTTAEIVNTLEGQLRSKRVFVTIERPAVDIYIDLPSIPKAGEKVLTDRVRSIPGGVNGNFAAALATIGASVSAAGSDGDDQYAAIDRDDLKAAGVNAHWDAESAGPSTVCYVLVDKRGERSILISYPSDIERAFNGIVAGSKSVLEQGFDLSYLGVLRPFHGRLAPFWDSSHLWCVTLENTDWPSIALRNQVPRMDFVFCADETYDAHRTEILELQRQWNCVLVVTRGRAGSEMLLVDGTNHVVGPSQVTSAVVDTTGAGDAFAAAFCAAYLVGLRGSSLLRVANWYAAQKIQQFGPRNFGSKDEFLKELAREFRMDA